MEITPRTFERAVDKLTQDQLDTPVDEVDVEPSTESVPEEAVEPDTEAATPEIKQPEPEPEEEEKVPKSRFLTVHQRAIEAEKRLRQFEAQAKQPKEETPVLSDDDSLRQHYVEIFGESELTDKLYKAELARLASIEDKAAERAYERLSQREQQEQAVIQERVQDFDRSFEELEATTGQSFDDDAQVAILDIVEKYSPKDDKGHIIADYLMPFDQAYEIYQIQNAPKAEAKRAERNKVASLSGARSEGAPSGSQDADWQPGQERRWWNKV